MSFFAQKPGQGKTSVLTINGGSSSIKFAVFQTATSLERTIYGKIDRIGFQDASFDLTCVSPGEHVRRSVALADYSSAANLLIQLLDDRVGLQSLAAIGHRVVHGMHHTDPQLITPDLMIDLRRIIPCDPQHLPGALSLIEILASRAPNLPQFACFDTSFHTTMPRVAKLLAIPRRFDRKGVQRYGFHGLSYAFLMQELTRIGDPAATCGRVILAHLGNGASLCAVRDGRSVETSMGFTPAAGLPMGSRSGDLDPGLVGYLARTEQMSISEFDQMVNHHAGLLGISELSSDMRDLTEREGVDVRAAEAVELFCYQTKKWIGALVATLGGLDTLVFAGGIGENSPNIRQRICEGLGCFGIQIDQSRNTSGASVISSVESTVTMRVLHTDEEQMIAHAVYQMLGNCYA